MPVCGDDYRTDSINAPIVSVDRSGMACIHTGRIELLTTAVSGERKARTETGQALCPKRSLPKRWVKLQSLESPDSPTGSSSDGHGLGINVFGPVPPTVPSTVPCILTAPPGHRDQHDDPVAFFNATAPVNHQGGCTSDSRFYFPLTPDHLLTLIYYNVYRGLNTNYHILQLKDYIRACNAEEEEYLTSEWMSTNKPIPETLRPSPLQVSRPHCIWLDIFPHAGIRDNMIRCEDSLDMDELCTDLIGHCPDHYEGFNAAKQYGSSEGCGLVVWGDPWDIRSWEATPGFLRKYGFLLEGCPEMMVNTNYWRDQRGEEPLIVEL